MHVAQNKIEAIGVFPQQLQSRDRLGSRNNWPGKKHGLEASQKPDVSSKNHTNEAPPILKIDRTTKISRSKKRPSNSFTRISTDDTKITNSRSTNHIRRSYGLLCLSTEKTKFRERQIERPSQRITLQKIRIIASAREIQENNRKEDRP